MSSTKLSYASIVATGKPKLVTQSEPESVQVVQSKPEPVQPIQPEQEPVQVAQPEPEPVQVKPIKLSYASIVASKPVQPTQPEPAQEKQVIEEVEIVQPKPAQPVQQRKYPRPNRNYRPVYNSRVLTPYEQKKVSRYCKDNNCRIFCDCCQSHIISEIIKRHFESCGDCPCCDPDAFF